VWRLLSTITALYGRLVEATVGEVWSGDVTAVTLREPPQGPQDVEAAVRFWDGLFAPATKRQRPAHGPP
jgi:hypothetical protein